MDYKDKYNKLVNAIKVLQETNPSDKGIQNWINDNVPELAESEDEQVRKEMLSVIKQFDDDSSLCGKKYDYRKWIAWLEKQVPIDKELAQAKKEAYNEALDKIEYHSGEPTFDDGWNAAIWYLKKRNGRPKYTWKPSKEQMEVLLSEVTGWKKGCPKQIVLESLYNDLKKLK